MENIITLYICRNPVCSSEKLLLRAVTLYSGISEYEFSDNTFNVHREKNKKPYFTDHSEIKFSVSHSGSVWLAAFSEYEVGVDVQLHTKRLADSSDKQLKLAKRFFHPAEYDKLLDGYDFFDLWARKEAYCKLDGRGIDKSFPSVDSSDDTVKENGRSAFVKSICLTSVLPDVSDKYSCALCSHHDFHCNVVCM